MTRQELTTFLFRHGIVRPTDAVDGDLAIVTVQRGRYALHEVCVNQVPKVMAKAALEPQDRATLAAEAAMLSIVEQHERLRGIAPKCVASDAQCRVLVMEHLGHAAALPAPSALERALAASRTLAALHRETAGRAHGFTRELPPIFAATRFGVTARPDALARLWQLTPDPHVVAGAIEQAAALWRQQTLIHSDVKAEHWIERAPPSRGDARLIDWELTRFGDPAWDVGSVLQEHLLGNPPTGLLAPVPATPHIPGESRAFVKSYLDDARPVLGEGFPIRAVLCIGVRLVQTALELLTADHMSDEAGIRFVLQTAESVFRRHVSLALNLFPDLA